MKSLVSVIMPIYNVEKFLRKSINSVLNQTYKNLEIILVDDGSTDESGKICDEYKSLDKRITVIHKKNGGLSDARNKGIEVATGEFIYFIDSDDYIDDDTIEYLLSLLLKNNSDISCSPYKRVYLNEKNNEIKNNNQEEISNFTSNEALYHIFYLRKKIIGWEACNKLYKKALFKDVRFPYAKKYEDVGTVFNLIGNAKKITFSNIPKYNYMINENSITHVFRFDIREFDRIEMAEYMRTYINLHYTDNKLIKTINNFVCTQYISVVNVMIRCNKIDKNLIKNTKKQIKIYLKDILHYGTNKGKMQAIILLINFKIYRKIFKIKIETNKN